MRVLNIYNIFFRMASESIKQTLNGAGWANASKRRGDNNEIVTNSTPLFRAFIPCVCVSTAVICRHPSRPISATRIKFIDYGFQC